MREYIDIVESAETDIDQSDRAREIIAHMMGWLRDHNEYTPLGQINGVEHVPWGKGRAVLLPEYAGLHNLRFGFTWGDHHKGTDGYLTRGIGTHHGMYYVMLVWHKDPSDEIDLAFSINTNILQHEVVHYLDYERSSFLGSRAGHRSREKVISSRKDTEGKQNPQKYYNDPLELNAFFQQAVDNIRQEVYRNIRPSRREAFREKALKDFDTFYKYFWIEFHDGFRGHIRPSNLKKLKTRLYKLYELIRSKFEQADHSV